MRKTKITKTQHFQIHHANSFDVLAECVVKRYKLDKVNRQQHLQDQKQFFILWWDYNRSKFNKYESITSMSILLQCNHATVIHHIRRRTATSDYKKNINEISEYIDNHK